MTRPVARTTVPVVLGLALLAAFDGDRRPDEALASFELDPEFTIELVAAEPVVFDPVDLEFDERGRAFVLEMPGYPFLRDPGRVVRLGDEDGDGRYESRKVFADGLAPTADSILPHRGGLLVASPPDLVFLADTDDDGVADERRVEYQGFANGNPQHNFNGLTHGLDNWIYGANGGNSGEVYTPRDPGRRVSLHDDDFRFDPRSGRFERTGESAGGFGITFDSWGRSFGTHNTEHVSHLVYPARYLEGLPGTLRRTRHLISDHGSDGPARIYPIGVQETRVNHPEQSGHFSGACGITAYTGGAYGPDFEDNLFVADVVLNLVHRAVVRPNGASLVASRAKERVEFLASRDRAFRPVNMTVGPDGAIYLLDMHRAVIEHPEWIPDEIEAGLDLEAGKDKGRVYRLVPRAGLPRVRVTLDSSQPEALVKALGHPNKWWRDTAQRLLVDSRATGVVPSLQAALRRSPNPHERLHALWTLEGLDALDESGLLQGLADAHPRVRENALVAAEPRAGASAPLREAVRRLAGDEDARVRMQVALSLGTIAAAREREALLAIAARDADDRWTRLALLGALGREPLGAVLGILQRPGITASAGGRELLRELAARVPRLRVSELIDPLRQQPDAEVLSATLEGLADGLEALPSRPEPRLRPRTERWLRGIATRASDSLALSAGRIARALGLAPTRAALARLARGGETSLDPSLGSEVRLAALRLFELMPFDERRQTLFELLGTRHPPALQLAAFAQLARSADAKVASGLLARWSELGREVRAEAGSFLLGRRANHRALLSALEDGKVTRGELNLDLERRRALLRSPDGDVRARAAALFSDAGVVTRAEALARMRAALELRGDAVAGRAVFAELCARCHRFGGEGTELGPDLTEISRKSAETLLNEVIDPNAAVETRFVSYTVETRDGRILNGILLDETDDRLTVREAGGRNTELGRSEIARIWTNGLSLMPEELESGMELQAMANLIAFLQTPR